MVQYRPEIRSWRSTSFVVNKITGQEEIPHLCRKSILRIFWFPEKKPQGAEVLLHALDFSLAPAKEIVIAGDPSMDDTKDS